MSLILSIYKDQ